MHSGQSAAEADRVQLWWLLIQVCWFMSQQQMQILNQSIRSKLCRSSEVQDITFYFLSSVLCTGCPHFHFSSWLLALPAEWEEGLNTSLPAGVKLYIVALVKKSLLLFLCLPSQAAVIICSATSLCFNPRMCDWQAHYSEASNADEENNRLRCRGDKYRPRAHYKVFNSATGEVFCVWLLKCVCVDRDRESVCERVRGC